MARMGAIVSSCVFDLDATIAASYDGTSQTFSNYEDSPADGEAQSAYDFYLGNTSSATTDDPTFNGSSGSSSAYFSFDGDDQFTLKSGINPTFLEALHKTTGGTPFWMACAFRLADAAASRGLFRTNSSSAQLGILLNINSSEVLQLFQGDGTTGKSTTGRNLTIGNDYVIICSYDGANYRSWINELSKTSQSFTFNTATGAATNKMRLMANIDSGTRGYAWSMGNAHINDAEAAAILYEYEARHQRDYNADGAIGAITGTIAQTEANDTSTATGTLVFTGTVAQTNAADTSTATGTLVFTGTVAQTNAADTSTATGTLVFTGTVAQTESNDIMVGIGDCGKIVDMLELTGYNFGDVSMSGTKFGTLSFTGYKK